MMTQSALEAFLDEGRLKMRVRFAYGNKRESLWMMRRNGRTKLWKTRPGEFRIPVKIGWRSYSYLTERDLNNTDLVVMDYKE